MLLEPQITAIFERNVGPHEVAFELLESEGHVEDELHRRGEEENEHCCEQDSGGGGFEWTLPVVGENDEHKTERNSNGGAHGGPCIATKEDEVNS
jgi:hypothetical protein